MSDWKLLDPVSIPAGPSLLEGVVAYLEGEETVGVRLTGSSVGLGITNVAGKFECPDKGGLWTVKGQLRRRQLTKIEELRLRRELANPSMSKEKKVTTTTTTTTILENHTSSPPSPSTISPAVSTRNESIGLTVDDYASISSSKASGEDYFPSPVLKLKELKEKIAASQKKLGMSTEERLTELKRRKVLSETKNDPPGTTREQEQFSSGDPEGLMLEDDQPSLAAASDDTSLAAASYDTSLAAASYDTSLAAASNDTSLTAASNDTGLEEPSLLEQIGSFLALQESRMSQYGIDYSNTMMDETESIDSLSIMETTKDKGKDNNTRLVSQVAVAGLPTPMNIASIRQQLSSISAATANKGTSHPWDNVLDRMIEQPKGETKQKIKPKAEERPSVSSLSKHEMEEETEKDDRLISLLDQTISLLDKLGSPREEKKGNKRMPVVTGLTAETLNSEQEEEEVNQSSMSRQMENVVVEIASPSKSLQSKGNRSSFEEESTLLLTIPEDELLDAVTVQASQSRPENEKKTKSQGITKLTLLQNHNRSIPQKKNRVSKIKNRPKGDTNGPLSQTIGTNDTGDKKINKTSPTSVIQETLEHHDQQPHKLSFDTNRAFPREAEVEHHIPFDEESSTMSLLPGPVEASFPSQQDASLFHLNETAITVDTKTTLMDGGLEFSACLPLMTTIVDKATDANVKPQTKSLPQKHMTLRETKDKSFVPTPTKIHSIKVPTKSLLDQGRKNKNEENDSLEELYHNPYMAVAPTLANTPVKATNFADLFPETANTSLALHYVADEATDTSRSLALPSSAYQAIMSDDFAKQAIHKPAVINDFSYEDDITKPSIPSVMDDMSYDSSIVKQTYANDASTPDIKKMPENATDKSSNDISSSFMKYAWNIAPPSPPSPFQKRYNQKRYNRDEDTSSLLDQESLEPYEKNPNEHLQIDMAGQVRHIVSSARKSRPKHEWHGDDDSLEMEGSHSSYEDFILAKGETNSTDSEDTSPLSPRSASESLPGKKVWWQRKEKKLFVWLIVLFLILLIIGLGSAYGMRSVSSAEKGITPNGDPSISQNGQPSGPDTTPVTDREEFWTLAKHLGVANQWQDAPDVQAALEWMTEDYAFSKDLILTALRERYAIVVLHMATNKENKWISNYNFLSANVSVCEWNADGQGVYCDNNNQVTEISLVENDLSGTIPPQLYELEMLESLSLGSNQLSGPIPSALGKLQHLYSLNLSNNNLSGTIPESLSQALQVVNLSHNKHVSGTIPTSLVTLPGLSQLALFDLNLEGTIPEFSNNPNLAFVALGRTKLTGNIPSSLTTLPNLKYLYLVENELSGPIPTDFHLDTESQIQHLYLSGNRLSGVIPADLTTIDSLIHLGLDFNLLTGSLPPEMSRLKSLQRLFLNNNENLSGKIRDTLSSLDMLEELFMQNTGLISRDNALCDDRNDGSVWKFLVADCNSDADQVVCTCCDACCPAETNEGDAVCGSSLVPSGTSFFETV